MKWVAKLIPIMFFVLIIFMPMPSIQNCWADEISSYHQQKQLEMEKEKKEIEEFKARKKAEVDAWYRELDAYKARKAAETKEWYKQFEEKKKRDRAEPEAWQQERRLTRHNQPTRTTFHSNSTIDTGATRISTSPYGMKWSLNNTRGYPPRIRIFSSTEGQTMDTGMFYGLDTGTGKASIHTWGRIKY